MKVLAVNSSLRTGGESKSELLLTHLVEGMSEAGAEVTVVNLREKTVKYCLGCFTCSTKSPGRCVHQDDMARELYPLWAGSEIAVLATPLFYYTVNAPLKAFIDRTWLDCEPYLVPGSDGRWTHPARHQIPSIVMLSAAGFPHESDTGGESTPARLVSSRPGAVAPAMPHRKPSGTGMGAAVTDNDGTRPSTAFAPRVAPGRTNSQAAGNRPPVSLMALPPTCVDGGHRRP